MRSPIPTTTGNNLFAAFIGGVVVRYICAALLLGAGLATASLLVPLVNPTPATITDTPAGADVRFTVDRPVTRLDGCFTASWAVTGVESVRFAVGFDQPQGVIGEDSREVCITQDSFVSLSVDDLNGDRGVYRVATLISTARLAPVYALLSLTLFAGAGMLMFAPHHLLHPNALYAPTSADRGLRPSEWGVLAGILALIVAAYWPAQFIVRGGDYEVHVYYSQQIAEGAPLTSPHFVNQLLTIGTAALLPGDDTVTFFAAQFWVNLGALLLTGVVIYGFLRYLIGVPEGVGGALRLGLFTIAGMIAAPVFFPTLNTPNLFMGYIPSSNLFHNPTYTLMRPISVLLVWIAVRLFRDEVTRPWLVGAAAASLIVLSLLTKPNHVIIYVPAVGLLWLWHLWHQRRIRWTPALVAAAALPVLALQFGAFFTAADAVQRFTEPSQVILAPLAAMLTREPNIAIMALKLVLSSAFPLALTALYWADARRDVALQLTWAAYGVGLLYAYLLAEAGKVAHANFIFSAQAGLDMLTLAAIAYFARAAWRELDSRSVVAGTLLALHVAAGVIWHGVNVASGYGFFWW